MNDGMMAYYQARFPGLFRLSVVLAICAAFYFVGSMVAVFGHPGAGLIIAFIGPPIILALSVYAGARNESAYLQDDPLLTRRTLLDGLRDGMTRN